MLEYVMIVVFVALAGMTVWRVFGQNIRTMVERANSQLVEGFEDTQRDRGGALPRIR
jgi:Flp pilus assembly pilin Flp